MTLNLQVPEVADLRPKITVFGVGGAGCNAVNNMIEKQLDGVEFIVANTDAQALQGSKAPQRVQLGEKVTEGLGAGARPEIGASAAEESIEIIVDHLAGSHMCFITAGMGGGTGTGAAPIVAQAARELGILTVGVVTKPFQFEGAKRMRQAEEGVEALQKVVDTLIIIPNQNLFRLATENTTFSEAFSLADDVLYQGVKGVTDLMVRPGLINLDFADIRVVMDEMGKAMMGTGEAAGEDRAVQAAENAIANPLLDDISLEGAKGVLINIIGGQDLTLFEVDEAANLIRNKVDPDANIIVGSTLDPSIEGMMRVSVVATGIDAAIRQEENPVQRRTLKSPLPLQNEVQPEPAPAAELPPAPAPAMQQPQAAMPAAPAPAPAPAPELAAPAEPDLFAQPAPAPAPASDDFYSTQQAQAAAPQVNDIPEPAYRPQAEAPAAHAGFVEQPMASEGDNFHAASRSNINPGEPSQETLARLAAAVEKQPSAEGLRVRPNHPAPVEEAPRNGSFGLGGLLGRMSRTAPPSEPAPANPMAREQPRMSEEPTYAQDYEEMAAEDESIEIPAFLRRQAN